MWTAAAFQREFLWATHNGWELALEEARRLNAEVEELHARFAHMKLPQLQESEAPIPIVSMCGKVTCQIHGTLCCFGVVFPS